MAIGWKPEQMFVRSHEPGSKKDPDVIGENKKGGRDMIALLTCQKPSRKYRPGKHFPVGW